MTMIGMNTESIRAVSEQLSKQSDEVRQIARAVDALVHVASQNWRGPDLRQFDGRWTDQYRASCLRLGEELSALARTAAGNVSAQETTSSTLSEGGGSHSMGGGFTGALTPPGGWPGWPGTTPGFMPFIDGSNGGHGPGLDIEGLYKSGIDLLDTINTMDLLQDVSWDKIKDAKPGSPLISSLSYLPDAYHAFTDAASGTLSPEDGGEFVSTTLELGGTFLDTFGTSAAGGAMGTFMGGAGGVVGVGVDAYRAYEDFQQGDYAGALYNGAHAGVAAVGVGVPPVGWCLDAWDAGVATGTWIAESPPMQQYEDNLVAYGAAHDSDIATRYDFEARGPEALFNLVGDGWHGIFG